MHKKPVSAPMVHIGYLVDDTDEQIKASAAFKKYIIPWPIAIIVVTLPILSNRIDNIRRLIRQL